MRVCCGIFQRPGFCTWPRSYLTLEVRFGASSGSLAFGLGALSHTHNFATLTAVVRSEWLVEMMQQDRLTIRFQPIVSTANPERIFA